MISEMEDRYFVGIRYEGVGKSYYYSTHIGDLRVGDKVVVENVSGLQIGIVSTALLPIEDYSSHLDLKPVLRRPTPEDLQDYNESIREAQQALEIAREEAARLGLAMKFLTSSFSLDGTKVTITYTADGRVDFRELLRILAPQLRCRIELHQIASRDKAKMVGGMGICGLPLCCATFLNSFDGISISRAKNQMLTLNIPKLSGACGKLICCLSYEDDLYTEAKKISRGFEPSFTTTASTTPSKPTMSWLGVSKFQMLKATNSFRSMISIRWPKRPLLPPQERKAPTLKEQS